jgi:hypothetical protein
MCDPIPDHIQLQNRQNFAVRMMEITRSTPEERPNQLETDIALGFRDFLENSGASPWVLDLRWEDVFDAYSTALGVIWVCIRPRSEAELCLR